MSYGSRGQQQLTKSICGKTPNLSYSGGEEERAVRAGGDTFPCGSGRDCLPALAYINEEFQGSNP